MQSETTDLNLLDEFAVEELEVRLEMSHGICVHFPCLRWDTDWLGNRSCGLRSNYADALYPPGGSDISQAACQAYAATTSDPTGWVWAANPH